MLMFYQCFAGLVLFHVPAFHPQECCLPNIQPIRRCLRATRSGSAALFREWRNLTLCGWKMERSCTAPTRCSSQWGSSTGRRFTGSSSAPAVVVKENKDFLSRCFQCRGIKPQHCRNTWAEFLWELKQEVISCCGGVKPAESGNNQQLVRNLSD